ncbi:MAG: hypothetical protein IH613_18020 [Desulfuromonadales bacterium]|nr:hypothetical protein [Desulfuromonadales bacterium]
MKKSTLTGAVSAALLGVLMIVGSIHAKPIPRFDWVTVVNNNDRIPDSPGERTFNSYNQPSVNQDGLVVFRARSRGGSEQGPPTHGIYTRDMAVFNSNIIRILDRTTQVPHPNNLVTTFVETPSFPRIDQDSDTIATRGNHPPVWNYVIGTDPDTGEVIQTRTGTTGIYANPFGDLITAGSKLGDIEDFYFYEVPEEFPNTRFEVFPGAPAVTGGNIIAFKGNYTVEGIGKTGVYYRVLADDDTGGSWPAMLIANNTDTMIPGTDTVFGSTSPPSAADGQMVFAGFDNEEDPTLGGIYLAPLLDQPPLSTLVSIGGQVPGELASETFTGLGEGAAFDGRFVGFWGSWGGATRTVRLYCAEEGNRDRIAYCNRNLVCADTGETLGDTNSICDETGCYQVREVPVNQGFFVHDIDTRRAWIVAKTGADFDDFLFWNYSGMTPCAGSSGHSEEGAEDDGEPARWRSSAFVAVSGNGATFNAAFKARAGVLVDGVYVNPVDGIYIGRWPGPGRTVDVEPLLDTTMNGQTLDPEAPVGSTITELGIEREGLRGRWLTVNASMGIEGGSEEDGMAGIYLTELPRNRR